MTKAKEPERHLEANNRALSSHFKYANNFIRTSKYTLLSFLPINLFEQFRRIANAYFLLQIIIMSIPEITALNPVSTAVPLIFVLFATGVKDAWDDFGRHRTDKIVNNKNSNVFINKSIAQEKWMKLEVGDVVRLEADEQVPADMILLTTSEENGLCYIETAELDGETNLKCRQPLVDTAELGDDEEQLAVFNGSITCETPNNRLDKFHGKLMWQGKYYPLDNDNLLLRGCVLRNTNWVYGVIVFAGHDTKLMMNSGVSKFKRSGLDKLLNYLIIWIAILLAVICALCSFGTTMWEYTTGKLFQQYLPWISIYDNSTVWIGIMHWPSFVMVLNTLIPISLYISVEVIRIGQSLWISWDAQMYHETTNTPARARTTTLTEELGQIEYIFSDKTGTLTQNVMTFKKCSIRGRLYGGQPGANTDNQEDVLVNAIPEQEEAGVDFSHNPYFDGKFKFSDQSLMKNIKNEDQGCFEMFRLLALCHTVMIEQNNEKLEYQAQSPDEAALVMAARNFGFVFKGRSPTTMTIKVSDVEERYELLAILDFNNVRKRMSVIVRSEDNKITLYCKGADNIMFERLDPSCSELMVQTTKHLNMFAAEGLRTLVTATKDIPENTFKEWMERYHEASVSLENRDEKVDQVYEEIEQNMMLVGATAIEDKLQDGVPDAIATLAEADIKIWVLTGDKLETAVNIGYSCHLLTDDMEEVFILEGESVDAVRHVVQECKDKVLSHRGSKVIGEAKENSIKDVKVDVLSLKENHVSDTSAVTEGKPNSGFGLVITGKTLAFALDKSLEMDFLELACLCKAVICCRVTPLQKALVVELVKHNKKAITLAIGDGANDVSMIKAAHIGIGISGQEGMQAVMASDYSFAQFRFLKRLLLVHGRWSYMRMCKFLNYFFYKNFAFTLVQLWYTFFCGFSAQTLYDPWFMSFYNVIFTSGPIVFIAIFDQDVSESACLSYPKLYLPGQKNILFNKKVFALSLLYGTLTSLDLFFIPYGAFAGSVRNNGLGTASRQFFGTVVAACLVITVNIEAALMTQYWTWINHFFTWGSILVYFCFYLVFYSDFVFNLAPQQLYYGIQYHVYGDWVFYVTLVLVVAICIIPSASYQFFQVTVHPHFSDLIRRKEQGKLSNESTNLRVFTPKLKRRKLSKRSSYAFAHQEGFGKIVTTRKSFFRRRKNKFTLNS